MTRVGHPDVMINNSIPTIQFNSELFYAYSPALQPMTDHRASLTIHSKLFFLTSPRLSICNFQALDFLFNSVYLYVSRYSPFPLALAFAFKGIFYASVVIHSLHVSPPLFFLDFAKFIKPFSCIFFLLLYLLIPVKLVFPSI